MVVARSLKEMLTGMQTSRCLPLKATYHAGGLSHKLVGMQCDDLTSAQAARLKEQNRPMLGYLSRLKARMVKRRFPRCATIGRRQSNANAIPELAFGEVQ